MIPVGLLIGLAWVPSSAADLSAYSASSACTTPNTASRTCWTEVPATVSKTVVVPRPKGNSDWRVLLTDQFGTQSVDVAHRSVFNRLTAGDEISARFWGGHLVLLCVPGDEDLPTDEEPGRQLAIAVICGIFALLAGAIFFLGGLGLHRYEGSWTLTASRSEWEENIFNVVAPSARRWLEFILVVSFVGLASTTIAYAWFDIPPLPVALVTVGLVALAYAWLLHHRARSELDNRKLRPKHR